MCPPLREYNAHMLSHLGYGLLYSSATHARKKCQQPCGQETETHEISLLKPEAEIAIKINFQKAALSETERI